MPNTFAWDPAVKQKYELFIAKMPLFHRRIADQMITEEAVVNAKKRNSQSVNEEDLLNAIFTGVPEPFYTIMLRLLKEVDFDYKKYGLPKVSRQ